VNEYVEVEEPHELKRLSSKLSANLKARFPHSETRNIGSPSGTFRRKVHFETRTAAGLYWSGGFSRDRAAAQNLFGIGTPGTSEQLLIWVQFNVPVVTFSRRFGGAFLRHSPTNRIVLAHRGIVTLGHSRVKRSTVFQQMDVTLREAETSNGVSTFLLIGELDSPTLAEEIGDFAQELRRVVRQPNIRGRARRTPAPESRRAPAQWVGRLREYFDEFSGERLVKMQGQGVADCYHGAVVRALRKQFRRSLEVLKSREVDLTVITPKRALLFEVKTSGTPQNIYTAIGQLTAHAPIVAKHAKSVPLTKVIVLPERPNKRFKDLLSKTLHIRVLTFRRSTGGLITIEGQETLGKLQT